MTQPAFMAMLYNAALLMALVLLYDTMSQRKRSKRVWDNLTTGLLLGVMTLAVMLNPWELAEGIVFDTRSILLSISGLFFGTLSTVIAAGMAVAYRLYSGGSGVWTGSGVILVSAGIGLLWRHLRLKRMTRLSFSELYLFGFTVHISMLLLMLTLPWPSALPVLQAISLPVLLIYPLATAVIGNTLVIRRERLQARVALHGSQERIRFLAGVLEHTSQPFGVGYPDGRLGMVNPAYCKLIGYTEEELRTIQWKRDLTPPEWQEVEEKQITELHHTGKPVRFEKEFIHKDGRRIPVELLVHLFRDEFQKEPECYFAFITDLTERKQAEQALRTTEKQLSNAMIIAQLGYWEYDVASDLFTFNDQFYSLFRTSAEQVGGYTMPSARYAKLFLHPGDTSIVASETQKAIETPDPHYSRKFEHRILYADGETGYIAVRFFIVKDEQGKTIKTYGANQDITERKEIEEALRNSELILTETGRLAKIGGWEHDLATGKAIWTQALYDIIEIESGSPPGVNEHLSYYPPEHRRVLEESYRRSVKEGTPFDLELQVHTAKGKLLWCRVYGEPVIQDGKCVKMRGTFQDIAKRKTAEIALRESETRFREVFSNMSNGVAVYEVVGEGEDFILKEINQAGAKIGRHQPEEVIGRSVQEVYPGVQEMGLLDVFREVYRTGQACHHPVSFYQDNRVSLWVENYICKLPTGEIFAVYEDVTERKQAEENRNQLESQLRQAQKMEAIGQLAGGVAHDFNNILMAMQGYSQFLLDSLDGDSDNHEFASEILDGTKRAATLTRQLLAFSRQQMLERKNIDLNDLVQNLLKMINRVIGEQIELSFTPSAETLILHADPGQLEQVVMNLCINSRDAMPQGGRLLIETNTTHLDEAFCEIHNWAEPGKYAVLSVTDTGMGMDELTQDRIFEPFFTTKEVGKGTGLGLSTVFGIVKQHEGLIHVYSEVNRGTTFKIYLPLLGEKEIPTEIIPRVKAPGGRETILLAEDEISVRRLTARILQNAGYQVFQAGNGDEAIDLIQKRHLEIDLILLDVVMPKKSGREVFEFFKIHRPQGRALFMSGYSTGVMEDDFIEVHQMAFIQKPFSPEALLKKVRETLDR